ncbi:hypothetical protein CRV24_000065 [Beauveria bassiana]|nr:hypothetical protein CRV24_000065 [Beauveria bassiana]KAH8721422.1 hypothetical protein HC256_001778 [Beauveria bassiana]
MLRVKKGASPADWANNKDLITKIWLERAKNAEDLADILREEHNFITTKRPTKSQKWNLNKILRGNVRDLKFPLGTTTSTNPAHQHKAFPRELSHGPYDEASNLSR